MEINLFKNKKIAVFGLAISGISTSVALLKGGANIIAWDDNISSRKNFYKILQYQYNSQTLDKILIKPSIESWHDVKYLILSPGIPINFPSPHYVVKIARELNIKIICDIELLYKSLPRTNYIAITGTNGKSTTTSLIGHLLVAQNKSAIIGGNIGEPVLSLKRLRDNGIYVLELSSFQLELIESFRPKISLLINITPDHLDRYENMAAYIEAKKRIFMNQSAGDIAIINYDCPICRKIYNSLKNSKKLLRIIPFSLQHKLPFGSYKQNDELIFNLEKKIIIKIPKTPYLQGDHNIANILAAITASFYFNIDENILQKSLLSFKALPHRMEYLGNKNHVNFFNDSKATNIESTKVALASLDKIHWIVGGKAKGEFDFSLAEPYYKNVIKAYVIGECSNEIIKKISGKLNYFKANYLDKAIEEIMKNAKNGDNILFSPACASFDQYKNFVARGEHFRKIYENLS